MTFSSVQPIIAVADLPVEYLAYGQIIRSSVAVHILVHWGQEGKRKAPDALADGLPEMASQMSSLGILF